MFPLRRKDRLPRCGAVIVAAGSARRMNGIDKIMAQVQGEPMIVHSVRAFQENPCIREIIVVTREALLQPISRLCCERGFDKVTAVVLGGADRVASVEKGVYALSPKTALIAVHDGARPFVTQKIITDTVKMAAQTGAAAPALPVKDTIKVAENGIVKQTPARERLFAVQTPQIFDADLLKGALTNAREKCLPITDDCSAVEAMGMTVSLTEGAECNLKVTTPMDLVLLNAWREEP